MILYPCGNNKKGIKMETEKEIKVLPQKNGENASKVASTKKKKSKVDFWPHGSFVDREAICT